jgi:Arc/MetJ family transcription regulator
VRDGRPYPDHGFSTRDWAMIPPRQIRLDTLVTTKRVLALDALLADDSTFYGDLFPHAVQWLGELYLEDGLHRALRAALQQRNVIHVRVLDLDALMPSQPAGEPGTDDVATAASPSDARPAADGPSPA